MNKVDPSKQVLYTSADYHHALKSTDKIKRAVSLVEGGSNVVDFSLYVSAYTELVEKLVATNDRGNDTNSKMDVAHNKLSKELQGLEKRITAASVTMGVTPPSKELMQILKINVPPIEAKPVKKWTWTEIAKYSAAAGATGFLSYQLYDSIQQLPVIIEKIVKATIKNVPTATNAGNQAFNAGKTYIKVVGEGINQGRKVVSSTTGMEIPPGDPIDEGFSFIINLGVTRYMWSVAKPYIIPFLGPLAPVLPIDLVIDGAILCNAFHPNCTNLVLENLNTTVNTLKEHPAVLYSTGTVALPAGAYFYNDIANAFSSTTGSTYAALPFFGTRFFATQAIDSVYPGLLKNFSETYPKTSFVSHWGGTVGALSGPGLAHFSGIAKAWGDAAKNMIPIPAPAHGVTDDVVNGVIKIQKETYNIGYRKAATVASFVTGVALTALPLVVGVGTCLALTNPITAVGIGTTVTVLGGMARKRGLEALQTDVGRIISRLPNFFTHTKRRRRGGH